MEETNKGQPAGTPPGGALSRERLDKMLADPKARSRLSLALSISGGLPGQFEPFSLRVDGAGSVSFAWAADAGTAEQSAQNAERVDQDVVRQLLGTVGPDDIAAAVERRVPIPPDSLVGVLEIEAGGPAEQVVFMADEEQAKTAGFELGEPLRRLVEQMIRIGEKASGSTGPLMAYRSTSD